MSMTFSDLPIALPDGIQVTEECEEELINKEWCFGLGSGQCKHFIAALQTTDGSVTAPGHGSSAAVIVTDVGQFFFGADASTIEGWFREAQSESMMEDGEGYYYPSSFSPNDKWEKFLESDRNKLTEYMIIPVLRLSEEGGSERENKLQEAYSRNISTIMYEGRS